MFTRNSIVRTLLEQVAAQAATILELERSLATSRANFDWLTTHVNELKAERAILLDRLLNVQVPVMEISREATTGPVRLTQDQLADKVAYMPAPGTVFRPGPVPPPDVTAQVAEALAAGDLFNDVGDDQARALKLGWDAAGELAYDTVPSASVR